MLVIVPIERDSLPYDCYDIHHHIKNVINNQIDYDNQTELFINYQVTMRVMNDMAPWQTISNITYAIRGNQILLAYDIRDQ